MVKGPGVVVGRGRTEGIVPVAIVEIVEAEVIVVVVMVVVVGVMLVVVVETEDMIK